MQDIKSKLLWQSVFVSILSFFSYWLLDDLLGDFKVLRWIPVSFFLIAMVVLVIKGIINKFLPPVFIGIVTVIPLVFIIPKSRILLMARLKADRSAVVLTLRADTTYQLSYETLFSAEEETGKYKIQGNKIILSQRGPTHKEFVPDTLTTFDNKIVMDYDSLGKPIIGYANHFEIEQNRIP